MDVFEAVDSRFSCRWFLDKPVEPAIVRELITRAARAASGGNLQPWKIHALTGAPLAALKRMATRHFADKDPRHAATEFPIYPNPIWEPYKSRRQQNGLQLYAALEIARDDAQARLDQFKLNFQLFNAPVALFITTDRKFSRGQWADIGGYLHTLMYLARGYGLDTCAQEAWLQLHREVGEFLALPAEQMLFCGVALGYADRAHPANGFRSTRAGLDEFCTFHGFDGA